MSLDSGGNCEYEFKYKWLGGPVNGYPDNTEINIRFTAENLEDVVEGFRGLLRAIGFGSLADKVEIGE